MISIHPASVATVGNIFQLAHEPELSFKEWAPAELQMPGGGDFHWRPIQQQPADDLFDPRVAELFLQIYSVGGKTFMIGAGLGYAVKEKQLECGAMFPAANDAKEWFSRDLMPVFNSTPGLKSMPWAKNGDKTMQKKWRNGAWIQGLGSSAEGEIARLQVDVMFVDEIDRLKETVSDAGDPMKNAFARTRGRRIQRHWAASYPGLEGKSKIVAVGEASQRFVFHYDCPRCGVPAPFNFDHLMCIVDNTGDVVEAWVQCPVCGERFEDDERRKSVSETGKYRFLHEGEWVLDQEEGRRKARHYFADCMTHTGDTNPAYENYLVEVASRREAAEKAEKPEKARRIVINTLAARPFTPSQVAKPDADALEGRRSEYDPNVLIPKQVIILFAGLDIQKRWLELQVWGRGLNRKRFVLFNKKFSSDDGGSYYDKDEGYERVDKFLAQSWKHPLFGELKFYYPNKSISLFVDSNHWPDHVIPQCKKRWRLGWRPILSADRGGLGKPSIIQKPKRVGAQFKLGVNGIKDQIMDDLSLSPGADGSIHFPSNAQDTGITSAYFKGLTCEEPEEDGEFIRWVNTKGQRNEPIDTAVYAEAAADALIPAGLKKGDEWLVKVRDNLIEAGQLSPDSPDDRGK